MTAAEERQNRIVELVSEKGNIQVDRLAQILDVSQMTIRRDLDKLDREGIIERRQDVYKRQRPLRAQDCANKPDEDKHTCRH